MSTASQLSLPLPPRKAYGGSHLWWHDAIIDEMIAHPDWTKKQIAVKLNCTPQIIYLVTSSDLFKAKFEQRRREFSEQHDNVILGKLTIVAEASLDILAQALDKKKDSIPIPILADIADKTLNRLGYGVKPTAGPSVQVNVGAQQAVVSVSADDLNEARAALRSAERQRLIGRTVSEGDSAAASPLRMVTEGDGAFDNSDIIEGTIVREERPQGPAGRIEGESHVLASVDQL